MSNLTFSSAVVMIRLVIPAMLIAVLGTVPVPVQGQDAATRRATAGAYIASHADREEMVMIPDARRRAAVRADSVSRKVNPGRICPPSSSITPT